MSADETKPTRSLGAVLADLGSGPPPTTPVSLPSTWHPRGYDKAVCGAAVHAGEDPAEVLREFHGNSALARTLRNIIGAVEFTPAQRVYMMRSDPRPEGMTRAEQDALIASHINSERDPLGAPMRAIDAGSVKKIAKRGQSEFLHSLADMFSPEPRLTKPKRKKGDK